MEGVGLTATHLNREFTTSINERILELGHLSQLVANAERLSEPAPAVWKREAEKLHHHLSGYHMLAWITPTGQIVRSIPNFSSQSAQYINLALKESHPTLLKGGRSSEPQMVVTSTVLLSPDCPGFLVYVPIQQGKELDGFIVAAFAFDELFQRSRRLNPPRMAEAYSIAVLDGNQTIYQQGPPPGQYKVGCAEDY